MTLLEEYKVCDAGSVLTPEQCRILVSFKACIVPRIHDLYSGPWFRGHPLQRPPSLMWPQMFVTTIVYADRSPFQQRPPL